MKVKAPQVYQVTVPKPKAYATNRPTRSSAPENCSSQTLRPQRVVASRAVATPAPTSDSGAASKVPQPEIREDIKFNVNSFAEDPEKQIRQLDELWAKLQANPDVICNIQPTLIEEDSGNTVLGMTATKLIPRGSIIMKIPGDLVVSQADVQADSELEAISKRVSQLIALTLWLMKNRGSGGSEFQRDLIATIPEATLSPLLWSKEEMQKLLEGATTKKMAEQRKQGLKAAWVKLLQGGSEKSVAHLSPHIFNMENFLKSFTAVQGSSCKVEGMYLLLPLIPFMSRTTEANSAVLSLSADGNSVVLVAGKSFSPDEEVQLYDGRSNTELALSLGRVSDDASADRLPFEVSLVRSDKNYSVKQQVLAEFGYKDKATFDIYADRCPTALISYVRLARLQDIAQLPRLDFMKDQPISAMNEYETFSIMQGDLQEMLQNFTETLDMDRRRQNQDGLTPQEKLALQVLASEKVVLMGFMELVRMRLAPIRGTPTKGGTMRHPDQDYYDIFDDFADMPKKPFRFLSKLFLEGGWKEDDYKNS